MNSKRGHLDLVSKTTTISINGLPAARAELQSDDKAHLELTWIAHGGLIYQVVGLAPAKRFQTLQPVFQAVAGSFRPLSASERANVTEQRVRLTKARAGETIEDLTSRTHSAWKKEEVAVANGLTPTDRLHEGQVLKVAVAEHYAAGNRR